uniref:Uncharacterized protein n=1 Tax=Physcomitrium patens TaxID=3218 RepID=A0A2K1IN75_PHYPA|nr:hypothetical protein PHYPA_027052 [Physcomitrium patens]
MELPHLISWLQQLCNKGVTLNQILTSLQKDLLDAAAAGMKSGIKSKGFLSRLIPIAFGPSY